MGMFCNIRTNPHTWVVRETDKRTTEKYGSEKLYNVVYGTYDDYPTGEQELEILMRHSIYEKILSGEYRVSKDSLHTKTMILIDKNNNTVKPLVEDFCY